MRTPCNAMLANWLELEVAGRLLCLAAIMDDSDGDDLEDAALQYAMLQSFAWQVEDPPFVVEDPYGPLAADASHDVM